jgi:Arc/MetJ family transcription regulator
VRTNIELDDSLVKEGLKLTRLRTKKDLVHLALKELIANKRRMNLLDLEGEIEFAEGYDYKRLRLENNG